MLPRSHATLAPVSPRSDRGHGIAVIDPHGDLAESLRECIPRQRRNDLVYFAPAEEEHALAINVLELRNADERHLVVSGAIGVFQRLFAHSWGPRLENTLRWALMAVTETRGATLVDVLQLLADERFRDRVVARLRDSMTRAFFEREFAAFPPTFQIEVVSAVQNKLGAALASPLLRRVLGQPRSGFSCRRVMDRGGILIANLAKGRIGEDSARLLDAILVTKFQLAAYSRPNTEPVERRPFTLYADEFATYATASFGELAAEAPRYALGLVRATQTMGSVDETLRRQILANAGTKVLFRLASVEDAEMFGAEFEPELSAHDLLRLGQHQIALRLCVKGVTSVLFTALAIPSNPAARNTSNVIAARVASTT